MTVYRNDPPSTDVTIEISNRKGFGFNYKHCPGFGIMVTEVVSYNPISSKFSFKLNRINFEKNVKKNIFLYFKIFDFYRFKTPGSAAALDGRLTPGDMITSINGENIQSQSLTDAIILIKTSQSKLTLKVSRPAKK